MLLQPPAPTPCRSRAAVAATPELMVVMPVFNEQASVARVVEEWFPALEAVGMNFVFVAIDDGSRDRTLEILKRLQVRLGGRFQIVSHENCGHGQTCLEGYRFAIAEKIPWVLQIDSDGQCDPRFFAQIWARRQRHDVVYGVRKRRDDGWKRVLASHILQLTLLLTCGAFCRDANVPYRLMRTVALEIFVDRIPTDFNLANVAMAVLLRKDRRIRHGAVPIRFRARNGGEPSVPFGKFGTRAAELVRQLRQLSF